jgi:hypothetical protein
VFTTGNGVRVKVETKDTGKLARFLRGVTAVVNLLEAVAENVRKVEKGVREGVSANILRAADESLDRFYSSVDWDRTGENVVRDAERIAEGLVEQGKDFEYSGTEVVMENAGVANPRRYSPKWIWMKILRIEIPKFEPKTEVRDVVARAVGLGSPLPTETTRGEVVVWLSENTLGIDCKYDDGRYVSWTLPILQARSDGLYFDVEGLIALSYLEDKYSLVSRLVEEMEREEGKLVDRLTEYMLTTKLLTLLFNVELPPKLGNLVYRVLGE